MTGLTGDRAHLAAGSHDVIPPPRVACRRVRRPPPARAMRTAEREPRAAGFRGGPVLYTPSRSGVIVKAQQQYHMGDNTGLCSQTHSFRLS